MHRNNLLELLRQYNPSVQEEIQYKKDIIAFIQAYKDCFERSLEVGHITASAWLVNKDNTQALLMHHAKLDMWCQLGGHCDGDSDALGVAVKEAQEESGINNIAPVSGQIFDIDIHLIPANKREKEHYHYDIRFMLQVVGDEQVVQNSESKELKWFTKDRSALPTDSLSVTRMFDKWLKVTI
ncbi:MAG: NUDIX hydrolase [Candidatus Dependentiae bacterium]|nr:NUDIX hydrolase [Candidatus Dependentiae bacterium]